MIGMVGTSASNDPGLQFNTLYSLEPISRKPKMADRRGAGGGLSDEVVKALIESNKQLTREMHQMRNQLTALELKQQQPQPQQLAGALTPAIHIRAIENVANVGGDAASDEAVGETGLMGGNGNGGGAAGAPKRGIKWRDSLDGLDISDHPQQSAAVDPPMRKIKFRDMSPKNDGANNNDLATTITQEAGGSNTMNNLIGNGDDNSSTTSSSSEDAIAFSGWARCFFQARHSRSATQITNNANSTTSQDTYLHLTIYSTDNVLHISNTEDRWKPSLIDPPIPLKYFYAAKVPGSRSGAALFLKNDSRRLRKYIFRFEFINRAVHQPPNRYIQFIRSGKAAKKSMRGINKMKNAFNKMGEEKKENIKENKKRAQDAFAAHLSTLDELLKESDDAAEHFVECVNTRNEEEEELTRGQRELIGGSGGMMMGDSAAAMAAAARRKHTKPPPPYWGSGFNRPSTNEKDNEDDDEDANSDSDFSEEDDELYYDDDNDDETFFDKVQVSTEQTLETLFNHIVK